MKGKGFERFLYGFVPAGTALVVASWLITGERSVGFGLLPFALLGLVWLHLRRADRTEGPSDAR